MVKWLARTMRFLREEDGPTAVEYAVMLALIIMVCVAAITSLGSTVNTKFSDPTLSAALGNGS
jgi:pilus assembly protein Flp/PilA